MIAHLLIAHLVYLSAAEPQQSTPSGGGGTDVGTIIIGIGTVLTALVTAIGTLRLSKNSSDQSELRKLKTQVKMLREDMITLGQHNYQLRKELTEQGLHAPPPPVLLSDAADPGAGS